MEHTIQQHNAQEPSSLLSKKPSDGSNEPNSDHDPENDIASTDPVVWKLIFSQDRDREDKGSGHPRKQVEQYTTFTGMSENERARIIQKLVHAMDEVGYTAWEGFRETPVPGQGEPEGTVTTNVTTNDR